MNLHCKGLRRALALLLLTAALSGTALAATLELDSRTVSCLSQEAFSEDASALSGVFISAVPSPAVCTVRYGTRRVCAGDVLPAAALEQLHVEPVSDAEAECSLYYRPVYSNGVGMASELRISLLNGKNQPPAAADSTFETYKNISNSGTLKVSDPDGDALTYCFERSYNSGAWKQVQASASRTFTEAVSTAWNTLKYRVRAKDSYGNYSAYTTSGDIAVIHNQPPVISGSNADLGIKRADFTYQYSVTDPDGDTVNVVEKIDGKTIATKNAITLGATQTLSVSGNTFTALTNAQHTITITATDSAGNSAVRTLTFTKSIAGFVITLSTPLEANSQPKRANIKVTRDIPAGGTFKVEATNNPFDASPVWEDCTNAVVQGVAHVFTNKINTAAQYGMNIRVTVQRGDALTACWVSGIGGNFE